MDTLKKDAPQIEDMAALGAIAGAGAVAVDMAGLRWLSGKARMAQIPLVMAAAGGAAWGGLMAVGKLDAYRAGKDGVVPLPAQYQPLSAAVSSAVLAGVAVAVLQRRGSSKAWERALIVGASAASGAILGDLAEPQVAAWIAKAKQ